MGYLEGIKVVVLDFDNTVVLDPKTGLGSEDKKRLAWYDVFPDLDKNELHIALEEAQKAISGGKGDRKDIVRSVYINMMGKTAEEEDVRDCCDRFDEIVQKSILEVGVSDENRKAIIELEDRYQVYVNTATPIEASLRSMEALGLSGFAGILGRPNTKAENLNAVIEKEGCNPGEVVLVDDQPSSRKVAKELGCRFIGMHTAAVTEWHNGDVDFPIIRSLAELL